MVVTVDERAPPETADPFHVAKEAYRKSYEADLKERFGLRSRVDAATLNLTTTRLETEGERRLLWLEWALEHAFTWKRHTFERWLHEALLSAVAELLVGKDWPTVGPEICRKRRWKRLSKMVCGKAPRRFGKSVSISKFIAGLTLVCLMWKGYLQPGQDFNISVFSTCQRASTGIKQYTKRFLGELGLADFISRDQQQLTELSLEKTNDQSPSVRINFLPAKAQRYVSHYSSCLHDT